MGKTKDEEFLSYLSYCEKCVEITNFEIEIKAATYYGLHVIKERRSLAG
jgi:hypothetical protein